MRVADWLVERGARHLVVMGRRQPSAEALQTIASMRDRGAHVVVVNADVADRGAIAQLIEELEADGTPLRGVVHAAGALDDGVLLHQTWNRFRTVMAAKVLGAWHLHELTRSLPMDFFVLFSSTASLLGHPGQSNYAAANAFLDALAHHRRAQGLPALGINWGPWSEIGLAVRTGTLDRARTQGVGSIDPASGLRVLGHLLQSDAVQACVLPADWPALLASFPTGQQPPLLGLFARPTQAADTGVAASTPSLVAELETAPDHLRWGIVLEHVSRETRAVLGLERSTAVDSQQGLRDLGLDSLMALELRNRLQRSVGQPLRATLALDCPTIEAIARCLAAGALGLEAPAAAGESNASSADDVLMNIEQLSDDEVDRMFATRVQGAVR